MTQHTPPSDDAGKRWRLRRLVDAQGFFSMVAIDQRPPIFAQLGRALGLAAQDVPFDQILAAKRQLATAFAPQASAMLVDPNWGYPAAADVLNPAAGLLLTLEDHRTTTDKRSHSIADWSVDKIRALGGDAVKLLAWYHPRAPQAVREHQQAWVQQVGEDCARCGLPFVLELLLYPLHEKDASSTTTAYIEDAAKHSDDVLHSVQTFADMRYRVDLFKLESPILAAQVPALDAEQPPAALDANQPPAAVDAEACRRAFAALHLACGGRPWVMLSAGASFEHFERVVGHAARAGAAGFLAGRALWSDALALWPDQAAVARHLQQVGVPRLQHLRALLGREGRPWQPASWLPGVQAEGEFASGR